MTATIDKASHKAQRAELQQRLKDADKFKAAMKREAEALEMAQGLVNSHQRTIGYLVQFENAFAHAAKAYNDLTNTIPNQLVNSCTDRSLKDALEVAQSIRSQLIAEHQDSKNAVKRAELDLASTRSRITQLKGEPAILKDGEPMPWGSGAIQKAFGALKTSLGMVEIAQWAISDDDQNIAFGPATNADNAHFYADQWHDGLRTLRMARAANDATEKRLKEASEALAAVKQRMIWSPI